MNRFLDWLGDFLAERLGLLPLIGVGLILLNLMVQLVAGPNAGWFVSSNVLLHIGLVVSIIGLLLIRVLR